MPIDLIEIYSAEEYDNTPEASAAMTFLRVIWDFIEIDEVTEVVGEQGIEQRARARAFVDSARVSGGGG